MSKTIFLCSICNINSGTCNEDCKFCTQSVRYHADIERYTYKSIDTIVQEARQMEAIGALGFCLVSAHKALEDKMVDFVCSIAHEIRTKAPKLRLIGCNGTASVEQLQELKKAGIVAYNHNLETSEAFYPQVCTTHSWQERYETCENVHRAGLKLISGGIFGMGETHEDRVSFLESIKSLNPISVPLNFYHHNPALPLQPTKLGVDEALELIALARRIVDGADRIMVAGGREMLFQARQEEIFDAGANSIVIGNYLTTKGREAHADLVMLERLGYAIATHVS